MRKILILAASMIVTTPTLGVTQDFNRGLKEAEAGNYELALEEWLPLAKAGDIKAQVFVGMMYYDGRGVQRDLDTAYLWLEGPANAGDSTAQYLLGEIFTDPAFERNSPEQAIAWYRRSAEQGMPMAQRRIADAFGFGVYGLEQSYYRAYMWAHIALKSGLKEASNWASVYASFLDAEGRKVAEAMGNMCIATDYQSCGW